MFSFEFWIPYGEAAKTAAGFFWKSGWAFVLGYFISAMIQAFVPKGRLTPYLGCADAKSVSLATAFGASSSSCSFAALAAARALVMKGAHTDLGQPAGVLDRPARQGFADCRRRHERTGGGGVDYRRYRPASRSLFAS